MKKSIKYKMLINLNRNLLKSYHYRVFKFQRPKWKSFLDSKEIQSLFIKYCQKKNVIFQKKANVYLLYKSNKNSFLDKKSFFLDSSHKLFPILRFRLFNKISYNKKNRLATFFIQKSKFFLFQNLFFLIKNPKNHKLNKYQKFKNSFFYFTKPFCKKLCNLFLIDKNLTFDDDFLFKIKKKNLSILNPYLLKSNFDKLEKVKNHSKNLIQIKNLWNNIFRKSLNLKNVSRNSNFYLSKKGKILKYLIKPYYKLNILLWNLFFFSSPREASQQIAKKKVFVNNRIFTSTVLLTKGDIVSLELNRSKMYFKSFSRNYSFIKRYISFIEVDFETEIIIVIKDFKDLSIYDFFLLMNNSLSLRFLS